MACLHGFSYETAAVTDNRTLHYPEKKDDLYHIGILHGQADGYSGHSRYAPFLVSELLKRATTIGRLATYIKNGLEYRTANSLFRKHTRKT